MKKSVLSPEILNEFLNIIIPRSNLWENKLLKVIVIANPSAGGFSRPRTAKHNFSVLKAAAEQASGEPISMVA